MTFGEEKKRRQEAAVKEYECKRDKLLAQLPGLLAKAGHHVRSIDTYIHFEKGSGTESVHLDIDHQMSSTSYYREYTGRIRVSVGSYGNRVALLERKKEDGVSAERVCAAVLSRIARNTIAREEASKVENVRRATETSIKRLTKAFPAEAQRFLKTHRDGWLAVEVELPHDSNVLDEVLRFLKGVRDGGVEE